MLQAAARDRPGSVKSGPYSHGTFPGGGQCGTVEIVDRQTSIEVTPSGQTWDGELLVSERFSFSS